MSILFAILAALFPACETEDSSWCEFQGQVSLGDRDPAPISIPVGY